MASPQQPQEPTAPVEPTGVIATDISQTDDLRLKPGTDIMQGMVRNPDGTLTIDPNLKVAPREKPVSSQTIEPVKPELRTPESKSMPPAEGRPRPFYDPRPGTQPLSADEAMRVQRAGERRNQKMEITDGQAPAMDSEGRQLMMQEEGTQRALATAEAREDQRMPETGPVPNTQSTSEQVRGLGDTQEQSFGRDMVESHQRNVEGVMDLARKAGIPVDSRPEIKALVEAAVSLPSDQIGAAVEALLLQGNTTGRGSRDTAATLGMIASFMGSLGYGAVQQTLTSSARMSAKTMGKLPTSLERSVTGVIPSERLLRLGQVGEEAIKVNGGATLDTSGRAVKIGEDEAVVSVLPGRARIVEGQATAQQIRDFALENSDVLAAHPELRIGLFEDGGKTYLDLSIKTDPEHAKVLGLANNQKSIYLGSGQVLELGGTGVGGGSIDEATQLASLRKTVASAPHSGVADTLAAEAAQNLADTPTGVEVFHGASTAFNKVDVEMGGGGHWVAEDAGSAGRFTEDGDAPNVRPYYIDPQANLISKDDAYALVGRGSSEEMSAKLREIGYDGMVFEGSDAATTAGASTKGRTYFIFNPGVLIEKFTGERAGMLAMAGAGAAAGAMYGEEEGGIGGAAMGAMLKGKGKNLLKAEKLAKSAGGNLRYLAKNVDWAARPANSKEVGGVASYAAALRAQAKGALNDEELAQQLVGQFGPGIEKHLKTILERADERYAEVLSRVELAPVERVVEFFKNGKALPEWYASGARMREAFGGDAPLIANLIAATSAHNANSNSVKAAMDIFHAFKTGKISPDDIAGVEKWFAKQMKGEKVPDTLRVTSMKTHLPNIIRALTGQELSGNKVWNYAQAILGNENAVVIDTHMVEAFAPSVDFKKLLREVPKQYREAVRARVEADNVDWVDLVFSDDSVYSYFEGLTRKFAAEHGVTPRFAQEAIWKGRVDAEGKVKESNQPIVEMFEKYATAKGYQADFPGLDFTGTGSKLLIATGAAALFADLATQSEGEGGTTPAGILAIVPGIAGNKKMMKYLVESVRELRRVKSGAIKLTGDEAMDILTKPNSQIRTGDKLIGLDWIGMSKDVDHLPSTIRAVREHFEEAIKADSRGVVSHDLERQMAQTLNELGYDAESIVAKWKEGGRAVVSTEIMATAELTKLAYQEASRLAGLALKANTPANVDEFARAMEVFSELALVLDGQAEEAGRALGVFRAVVGDLPKQHMAFAADQARMQQKGLAPQRPRDVQVTGGTFEPQDPAAMKNGVRKLVDDNIRSFAPDRPGVGGDPTRKALLEQVDALVDTWNEQVKVQPDAATQALKEQVGALVRQWNDAAKVEKPSTKQRNFDPRTPEKPFGQRSFDPREGEPQARPVDEAVNELLDQVGRLADDFNAKSPKQPDELQAKLRGALGQTIGDFNERGATAFGGRAGTPKGFQGPPTPSAVAGAMMAEAAKAKAAYGQYILGVLDHWSQLPAPSQRKIFAKALVQWGLEAIKEAFYWSYLATFPGQIANMGGTMAVMAGEMMSKALAVGIGKARYNMMGWGTAGSTMDQVTEGTIVGMQASTLEALWAAGQTFVTGTPASAKIMGGDSITKAPRALTGDRLQELAALRGGEIPNAVYHGMNVLAMTMGWGSRLMQGVDDGGKVVAFSGELRRIAIEQAHATGNAATVAEKQAYVARFLADPPETAVKQAREYAHYVTLTQPLEGKYVKAISTVGKSLPMVPFTPFFDTLVNIQKYSFEWAPGLNFLVKKSREDLFSKGPRADQALAKLGVGSVVMFAAASMYQGGFLQGPGPSDKRMLTMLQEEFKYVPNAIVWKDPMTGQRHQFGINRFDPIAFPFLFMAAWGDIMLEALNGREIGLETAHEAALAGVMAVGEVASTREYFQGFKKVLDLAFAKDLKGWNKAKSVLEGIAGQVVPSAGPQIVRSADPYMRETYGFLDKIYSRLPGGSDNLHPSINMRGEPKFRSNALGPDFVSPIPYEASEMSEVGASWFANDVVPEKPSRAAFGPPPPWAFGEETAAHGFMRTPAQQERYERLAGNELKLKSSIVRGMLRGLGYEGDTPDEPKGMWDLQEALLKSRKFLALTPMKQGELQRGLITQFRNAADLQLVKEDQSYRDKWKGKTLDRIELAYGSGARQKAEAAMERVDIDTLLNNMGDIGQ